MPQAVRIVDDEFWPIAVDRQQFRFEGLQLYTMCAAFGCRMNDLQCSIEAGIMIRRNFGEDKWAMANANRSGTNSYFAISH
jgi:hypothetical protein